MKRWFESKTVWTNIITIAIAVISLVAQGGVFGGLTVKILLLVVGLLNIALRLITNKGILKPVKDSTNTP